MVNSWGGFSEGRKLHPERAAGPGRQRVPGGCLAGEQGGGRRASAGTLEAATGARRWAGPHPLQRERPRERASGPLVVGMVSLVLRTAGRATEGGEPAMGPRGRCPGWRVGLCALPRRAGDCPDRRHLELQGLDRVPTRDGGSASTRGCSGRDSRVSTAIKPSCRPSVAVSSPRRSSTPRGPQRSLRSNMQSPWNRY